MRAWRTTAVMRLCISALFIWALVDSHMTAVAENRSVYVYIEFDEVEPAEPVIASVQQILGHAVGSGIVDEFIAGKCPPSAPDIDATLSFCAASKVNSSSEFEQLINQLLLIQPQPEVSYTVEASSGSDCLPSICLIILD